MRMTAVVLWGVSAVLVVLSGIQSALLWLTGPGDGPGEPIFTIVLVAPLAVVLSLAGAGLRAAGSPARVHRRGPLDRAAVWLWLLAGAVELAHLVFLVRPAERLAAVLAVLGLAMWLLAWADRHAARGGPGGAWGDRSDGTGVR